MKNKENLNLDEMSKSMSGWTRLQLLKKLKKKHNTKFRNHKYLPMSKSLAVTLSSARLYSRDPTTFAVMNDAKTIPNGGACLSSTGVFAEVMMSKGYES